MSGEDDGRVDIFLSQDLPHAMASEGINSARWLCNKKALVSQSFLFSPFLLLPSRRTTEDLPMRASARVNLRLFPPLYLLTSLWASSLSLSSVKK
jgi:hypothetical protein